ncbi:MAG: hypothetical protein IT349_08160 [Candidatus Eisenbacteria bacterium]|nr:hypothetical protein [Candidatus Eisenbacteria bacterium]MCC7142057.1 hypothetical protein [Candidatus Eisenbacteria bacterium]
MIRALFLLSALGFAVLGLRTADHGAVSEAALRHWASTTRGHHLSPNGLDLWREFGHTLPLLITQLTHAIPRSGLMGLLVPTAAVSGLIVAWLGWVARQTNRLRRDDPNSGVATDPSEPLAPVPLAPARMERAGTPLPIWLPALALISAPALLHLLTDPSLAVLGLGSLLLCVYFMARIEDGDRGARWGLSGAMSLLVLSEPNALYLLVGTAILLPTALRGVGRYSTRLWNALRICALPGGTYALVSAGHALEQRAPLGSAFALWLEPHHGVVRLDRFHATEVIAPSIASLPLTLAIVALGTPLVLVLGLLLSRIRSIRYRVSAVACLLVPLFAVIESHALGHGATPTFWLAVTGALTTLWLTLEPLPAGLARAAFCLVLALNAGSWVLTRAWSDPEARTWRVSLTAPVESTYADARVTSRILGRLDTVVLDEQAAFPLVALAPRPASLIGIEAAMQGVATGAAGFAPEAIVIVNPTLEAGITDRLHMLMPSLWDEGREGYEIAIERPGWRVYRRTGGPLTSI